MESNGKPSIREIQNSKNLSKYFELDKIIHDLTEAQHSWHSDTSLTADRDNQNSRNYLLQGVTFKVSNWDE